MTPFDRLRDAISGERRDWHRVEVRPDDIAALLTRHEAALSVLTFHNQTPTGRTRPCLDGCVACAVVQANR